MLLVCTCLKSVNDLFDDGLRDFGMHDHVVDDDANYFHR